MTAIEKLELTDARVLDGGMATELERLGCDLSGPLWSARVLRERPEQIQAVHASYLDAGADCLLTASYQVSAEAFLDAGLPAAEADRAAAESLRTSVHLAERARADFARQSPRKILIAASLGPYGAALHNGAEFHGRYDVSFEALVSFHARRLAVLKETNADLIAFETVPSLEEAGAIVAALERYPEMAAWVSFTCKDEGRVAHGERLSACAALLDAARQVVAVGINCTPPALVTGLIGEVKRSTAKPIVVYPNSGETWRAEDRSWSGDAEASVFSWLAAEWSRAGASLIGGCCRTGPGHIRNIAGSLAHRA